jgi:TolB-like protein
MPVTEPARAVFLSYASEDAEAAQRICEALRAVGIEVWFDQSELRGGDVWDQTIRKHIKACTLFMPVISRHTHARREGYFRLEWKLAVDRSNLISATQAFLVPVVIDDTREDDEEVPERIRDIHWTRLPAGETPPAFVERVQRLLSGEASSASRPVASSATAPSVARPPTSWSPKRALPVVLALAVLGAVGAYLAIHKPSVPAASSALAAPAASIAVLPLANESGEAGQQYFSDGISEDLITALSQFAGLKVIGRSSAFQFRDSKEDSRSIGAKLGVAHLLEGSVRRVGDTVRVSAELIDTADGSTQWSERYDRPYMGIQLATLGEVEQAIELAHQALATEPLRAAWYVWLATYLSGLNRLDEAERSIRTAIALQPGENGDHQTLTVIEVQRGNAQAALVAAEQEPAGPFQDIALALARQIGADRSSADAALRTLVQKWSDTASYQIAEIYALRNDANNTFEWLDRAWSVRDPGIVYLLYDPFILRYKGDPRFAAFCRKVGLPLPR